MSGVIEISLENVTLDYPIYGSSPKLFARKLLSIASAGRIIENHSYQYVRAIDGLTLKLTAGDRLGVIGGNGAGKTTLLKLISGIYHPTSGTLSVNGKISTILGTGFGLDENATGFENIALGGITIGFLQKEIQDKVEEIASFSELGNFLNLPLRTYSAGMKARLAFAIVTAIYPDILIIDEGIGAGDNLFYKKAEERFENFTMSSKIFILASHSEDLIKKFCNKVIVMHHGKIQFIGDTMSGLDFYKKSDR